MSDHQPAPPTRSGGPHSGTAAVAAVADHGDGSAAVGTTRRRRLARLIVLAAAVAGLAVIGLRGRLPAPRDVLDALTGAGYGWILLAALLQAASIGAFAHQQRRLLHSLGVHLRRGRAFAIILAGTALSISLPAGPALSTAFTIRQYERAGATREVAAASAIVSGLASIGGLALLYVGGGVAIVAGSPTALLNWRPLAVVVGLAALTAAVVLAGRRYSRRPPAGGSGRSGGRARRYMRTVLTSARKGWRAGAGLRTVDWAAALAYATVKWLADLLCLIAVARGLDLPVGVAALAGIYLSVQIVRQVPLTPGGVGVVETALVAGLTAAGATGIGAAAAVLLYRLLSCWLIIPVGGLAALMLRRDPRA
ncbi:flippase-like domain-containing protein [Dactylosporangium roseum]|uniref:Flippase-like domain-containing protein n=1 Tax=Dactylosporangium roseum TaxID=47989 RepID=A0ABY5YY48_9ACTN|nr:lysylphosphatidylglycerol synthase transmembrane domain-containing protein [Dactylosporangium roseum]UWZ33498.1 flippase-like domain-containing protein [Dactylosporangium roseum]